MNLGSGWIGVDLDATLAFYDRWPGDDTIIGDPIPEMVKRVQGWLERKLNVRIFTARAFSLADGSELPHVIAAIQAWCLKHIGCVLPITNRKDSLMIELWDDRCVAVEPNTGKALNKSSRGSM